MDIKSAANPSSMYSLRPVSSVSSPELRFPPFNPLAAHESGSFAEATVTKRLPSILESSLLDVKELLKRYEGNEQARKQVQGAIDGVNALIQSITSNAVLPRLTLPTDPDARYHPALPTMVASVNDALAHWQPRVDACTWRGLPWLVVETYMYVAVALIIQSKPLLAGFSTSSRYGSHMSELEDGLFDPFALQKRKAWYKSLDAAAELAATTEAVLRDLQAESGRGQQDTGAHQTLIHHKLYEILQYCLWGNKTDLSLLVDASQIAPSVIEANKLGQASQGANPLVVNEFEPFWEYVKEVVSREGSLGAVHIILDNSGLELYGDLLLGDFLTESGLASQVVFHGKCVPWFVSDASVTDFTQTINSCQAPTPPVALLRGEAESAGGWAAVSRLGRRWSEHMASGRWRYADHAFWTSPAPYCWMKDVAPDLYADLSSAGLVVFKGDLNYRKLTFDCRWPTHTPWADSLMGFKPTALLSLRTCKADVATGLPEGEADVLSKLDPNWMVNGKFGMVQFSRK